MQTSCIYSPITFQHAWITLQKRTCCQATCHPLNWYHVTFLGQKCIVRCQLNKCRLNAALVQNLEYFCVCLVADFGFALKVMTPNTIVGSDTVFVQQQAETGCGGQIVDLFGFAFVENGA
jgi:hypothetical protein